MTLFEITNPFGLTPNGPGIVPAVLEFRETARSRRDADWITVWAPRDRVHLVGLGIATNARRKGAER